MTSASRRRFRRRWRLGRGAGGGPPAPAHPRVLLVGSPNVGKSALFNRLTGRYVTVSNYPGTTVDIVSGRIAAEDRVLEVVDTPGMYSLLPITQEERVTRRLLFEGSPLAVIHVVDAKNIERMLGLTYQMIEAGLPVILALNMYDEAEQLGIEIDAEGLAARLGIPVVRTTAISGAGIPDLLRHMASDPPAPRHPVDYGAQIESALNEIARHLGATGRPAARTRALLLLEGDTEERERLVREVGDRQAAAVLEEIAAVCGRIDHAPHYYATIALKALVQKTVRETVRFPRRPGRVIRERLDAICMNPWTGFPLVVLVLYFGFYRFVGGVGAGVVVNFLEEHVFAARFNPLAERLVSVLIPWPVLQDLFAGEFGVLTMAFRYAVAIVLPIVGAFFLMFSLLEDTGYLPRLAMLVDRLFKKIGLNGRAVIPMVLGFGCDTMATIVTRTLETRRERLLCSILLALAVPCSAQLGVILGLLAAHPGGLLTWAAVVTGVFLAAGRLIARLLPGERPTFYMELPPLRLPSAANVLTKTYSRMVWYFREVLPLFVFASVLIWIGRLAGLFQWLTRAMEPAVSLLGLPPKAAVAFLFGFFRRDYGVAGLYDLQRQGGLNGNQLTVAAVTLTLFLPCVAQFLVMVREQGLKFSLVVSGAILLTAFAGGWSVHILLTLLGVTL